MKYKNAQNILPKELIEKLQDYVEGTYLYIPTKENNKKSWGELSGSRIELRKRNKDIYVKYLKGISIRDLANDYFLTESSIRSIIRKEKNI